MHCNVYADKEQLVGIGMAAKTSKPVLRGT